MVSASVSGVSTRSKSGKSGKIAPEDFPASTLWTLNPGIDPPPSPSPGFKCKCKRCIKSVIVRVTEPTAEAPEKLKMFRICEKLIINGDDSGNAYLKIYVGEEAEVNLILKCEHIKRKTLDSCIIFVDAVGCIIFRSEREGGVRKFTSRQWICVLDWLVSLDLFRWLS